MRFLTARHIKILLVSQRLFFNHALVFLFIHTHSMTHTQENPFVIKQVNSLIYSRFILHDDENATKCVNKSDATMYEYDSSV